MHDGNASMSVKEDQLDSRMFLPSHQAHKNNMKKYYKKKIKLPSKMVWHLSYTTFI